MVADERIKNDVNAIVYKHWHAYLLAGWQHAARPSIRPKKLNRTNIKKSVRISLSNQSSQRLFTYKLCLLWKHVLRTDWANEWTDKPNEMRARTNTAQAQAQQNENVFSLDFRQCDCHFKIKLSYNVCFLFSFLLLLLPFISVFSLSLFLFGRFLLSILAFYSLLEANVR